MPLRLNALTLFSLYLLLTRTSILAENQKEYQNEPEDRTAKLDSKLEDFLDESSSENVFTVQSAATTVSSATDGASGEFKIVIPEEKNISRQFTPSTHLGEITEPRTSANVFNNVQHIKFENEVDPGSYQQQQNNYQLVYEPVDQPIHTHHINQQNHQNFFEAFSGGLSDEKKGEPVHNFVKFQDDAVEDPQVHYVYKGQPVQHQLVHPIVENSAQYSADHLMGQQVLQSLEKPAPVQDVAVVFGKPSKFQVDPQKYELGSYSSVEPSRLPYFGALSEHQIHRPDLQYSTTVKKPNDGVVFVQESTFLRTRKFPYTFYQPGVGYHQIEYLNDDHTMYPARKRVSPWRKILHLIGAFLPLGLLLAALTPSVVRVDNVTQPNIVLSKWRVADLPVEHKQARIAEEQSNSNACEERSICELISASGGPGSSVLQNLLWNLATRTSTRVARENGLQEVFEAVKRKDCTKLVCRV